MKQASVSSAIQGDGKRRADGMARKEQAISVAAYLAKCGGQGRRLLLRAWMRRRWSYCGPTIFEITGGFK
jgi:hypothetical protein